MGLLSWVREGAQVFSKTYVPVPDNARVCGLPPPVSLTVTCAERAPCVVGLNLTVIVQLLIAARVLPQAFDSKKSWGSVPLIAIEVRLTALLPTLLSVIGAPALAVPTV